MTIVEATTSAAELGEAMRSARISSGRSVNEIATRFRGGGERVAAANSYLYDAEKGRRLASPALVQAYADLCDAPELLALRSGVDEGSGIAGSGVSWSASAHGPYAVLRRLEERFTDEEAGGDARRRGVADGGLTSELPEKWAKMASDFVARNAAEGIMEEPMVCHGRLESSLMVARLLSWAAKNNKIEGTVVIVSSDGDALYDPGSDDVLARDATAGLLHGTLLFRCIVECLLSRRIDVVHIRPEATTAAGAQKQIDALVQLLGYRGEYIPKNLGPTPAEPSHSILIPGVAAVQLMAANSPYCDSVVVIPSHCDDQYRLLASNIEGISRRRDSVAAFVAAGSFNQPEAEQAPGNLFGLLHAVREIDKALEELDAIEGERDALKDGLIAVTCPPSQIAERRQRFWEARKDSTIAPLLPALLTELDASSARRRDAYVRNLSRYRHTDVVTKRSIEAFVRTGLFSVRNDGEDVAFPDDYLGIDVPTPDERAEHLRSIISDLCDYPNYELLLVDGEELTELEGFGWAVKSRGSNAEVAFFEAIRTRRRKSGGIAQSYAAWRITREPLIDQIAKHARAECVRLRAGCPGRGEVIAYLIEQAALLDEMSLGAAKDPTNTPS